MIALQDFEHINFDKHGHPSPIGEGSYSVVYLMRHKAKKYVRAIRVCKCPANVSEEEKLNIKSNFYKEGLLHLLICNGGHPNIAGAYNLRTDNGEYSMEMEYIKGKTLRQILRERHGCLNFKIYIWPLIQDIVGAVAFLHCHLHEHLFDSNDLANEYTKEFSTESQRLLRRKCVIHNDIHDGNIMRRDVDGSYVLLDFGLSINNGRPIDPKRVRYGVRPFMSPEKFNGQEINAPSDVYALGVMLYLILTGKTPEAGKPINVVADRHETFYREKKKYDDIPPTFQGVIEKCLEQNPADRYPNAEALMKDLIKAYNDPKYNNIIILKNQNKELTAQLQETQTQLKEAQAEVKKYGDILGWMATIAAACAITAAVNWLL